MNDEVFSKLVLASEKLISGGAAFPIKRYLFNEIDNASPKFYQGVYGLRGVGKTVMLLQLASKKESALYIPLDAAYLFQDSLYDIVKQVLAKGYRNIFIDEINSRSGWTSDIKTLYDEGEANIVFTGSSSIEVRKGADLSRRVIMHELKPPSFREYLNIKHGANIDVITTDKLFDLNERKKIVTKYNKWNGFMEEYQKYGVLFEGIKEEFPKPITNMLEKIISADLSYLREIDVKIENDIYKLLYRIAKSKPYEANYSQLAGYLNISKSTVIKILYDLQRVGLILLLYPCGTGFRKEPKIYLRTPFRRALNEMVGEKTDVGAAREEFLVNNTSVECYFKTKRGQKTPDFKVAGKVIEVGGSTKISYEADFIAAQSLDFIDNKIPLFLFGFLY